MTERKVLDPAGNVKAWTQFSYDTTAITPTSSVPYHNYTSHPYTYTVRGNQTLAKHWRNTDGAWLTTTNYFNDVGNLVQVTDPGNHPTSFSYTDNYSDGVNRNSQAYVTQITYPATGSVSHIERKQYFWYTGLLAAECGQNFPSGSPCANTYSPPQPDYSKLTYDLLGRPASVMSGDGGQTNYSFIETSLPITVTSSAKIDSSKNLVNKSVLDGLGRVKQVVLCEDGTPCTQQIRIDTTYDAFGRKLTVSNPYRSAGDPTFGLTRYCYDPVGLRTTTPPDGTPPAADCTGGSNLVRTDYSGNSTTVTDQAGKQRRSFTDALGRLIEVHEPGNGQTAPSSGSPGMGSVQITGSEQSIEDGYWEEVCVLYDEFGGCLQWEWQWVGTTYWDYGGVSITVNSQTKSVNYSQSSTGTSIASALASAINADSGYPVTASVNGITVSLTSKVIGAASNYPLSATSWTNDPAHFSGPSFVPAPSGATLTGGTNADAGNPGFGPLLLSTPAITTYTYDVLDNPLTVVQSGSRPRTFVYNSLSQLTQAVNPESGSTCYGTVSGGICQHNGHDPDGNVVTKTDARNISITYAYDALHRLTAKTYSNSDPTVSYFYDQTSYNGLTIANGKGRRTGMSDASGMTAWSYEVLVTGGTKTTERRTVYTTPTNITKTISSEYKLDGSLWKLTYPSSRVVTYEPDSAARILSVKDTVNNINYAVDPSYAAHGVLQGVTYGQASGYTGIVFAGTFNNRLQPSTMIASTPGQQVMNFVYDFVNANGKNNGKVDQITNMLNPNRTITYTYDELNRLKLAQTQGTNHAQCFGLEHKYDIWANLTDITQQTNHSGCTTELHQTVGTNNRVNGLPFDDAGNQTSDGTYGLAWDAESRMKSRSTVNSIYDGDGQRVKKDQTNGSTFDKLYWYGLRGEVLAESDFAGTISNEFVYFGSTRIARRAGSSVFYYLADHLGTSRVIVQGGQNLPCYDADFEPFGKERVVTDSCPQRYKFTGKERDLDSGLDYFGARYYAFTQGRFLSADPENAGASEVDPQSWNAYAYARNNPLLYTDPDGLEYRVCTSYGCGMVDSYGVLMMIASGLKARLNGNLLSGYIEVQGDAGWITIGNYQYVPGRSKADKARLEIYGMKNFTINDLTPQEFALIATDEEVLRVRRALVESLVDKAVEKLTSLCPPPIKCGVVPLAPGPLGQGGRGLNITAANGTRVTGFTFHGLNRAIGDGAKRAGVKPSAYVDALKNPKKIVSGVDSQGRPYQIFTGKDARVVVNPQTGEIVSMNPLSKDGVR